MDKIDVNVAWLDHEAIHHQVISLVWHVILAIYVAKIDFIVFMASLGVK